MAKSKSDKSGGSSRGGGGGRGGDPRDQGFSASAAAASRSGSSSSGGGAGRGGDPRDQGFSASSAAASRGGSGGASPSSGGGGSKPSGGGGGGFSGGGGDGREDKPRPQPSPARPSTVAAQAAGAKFQQAASPDFQPPTLTPSYDFLARNPQPLEIVPAAPQPLSLMDFFTGVPTQGLSQIQEPPASDFLAGAVPESMSIAGQYLNPTGFTGLPGDMPTGFGSNLPTLDAPSMPGVDARIADTVRMSGVNEFAGLPDYMTQPGTAPVRSRSNVPSLDTSPGYVSAVDPSINQMAPSPPVRSRSNVPSLGTPPSVVPGTDPRIGTSPPRPPEGSLGTRPDDFFPPEVIAGIEMGLYAPEGRPVPRPDFLRAPQPSLGYGPEVFSPDQPQKFPGMSGDPALGFSGVQGPARGVPLTVDPGFGAPEFFNRRTNEVLTGREAVAFNENMRRMEQAPDVQSGIGSLAVPTSLGGSPAVASVPVSPSLGGVPGAPAVPAAGSLSSGVSVGAGDLAPIPLSPFLQTGISPLGAPDTGAAPVAVPVAVPPTVGGVPSFTASPAPGTLAASVYSGSGDFAPRPAVRSEAASLAPGSSPRPAARPEAVTLAPLGSPRPTGRPAAPVAAPPAPVPVPVPQELLARYDLETQTGPTVDIPLTEAAGVPEMGLQTTSGTSSPSATPEFVAADTSATSGDIPEGAYTLMGGGPLAFGANLLNPLRSITGGRPLFGENGLIPPSDPYTAEDFFRDQAEMSQGPENNRGFILPQEEAAPAAAEDVAEAAPAEDTSLSSGQLAAVPYVTRDDVALGPQYQMTYEQYLEMLRRFPGGIGVPQGLLTPAPISSGIGSLMG